MARLEGRHWWYLGLRDLLARFLTAPRLQVPPHPRVLDAGCGTGANLRFLIDLLEPSYAAGFDTSGEAIRLARHATPEAHLYLSDIRDPTLTPEPLDLILSLDVLYIPGVEASIEGLRRLVGLLDTGGLLVLNLPAYNWLCSEHDLAVQTSERYTAGSMARLMRALDLEVECLTYRVVFPFPFVVALRAPSVLALRLRQLFRRRRDSADRRPRSDLRRRVPSLLNGLLFRSLRLENRWIARGIPMPFGSSVLAVARKP